MSTSAPAVQGTASNSPAAPKTVKDWLETPSFKDAIAKALPKHMDPDRQVRVALTALTRTPLLAQCSPASLLRCMLDLSAAGLEPDGRRAHLIPYKNGRTGGYDCQLILDYKGKVELAMRSGSVSSIHADVVCDMDKFSADTGMVKHTVDYRAPRGKPFAVYCVIHFKDGATKSEVMTRDDVEAIRKRSRAGGAGPWVTDWNEMAKKTVAHRALKWVPLSPEIRDLVERDDDVIDIDSKPVAAQSFGDVIGALPEAPPEPQGEQQGQESDDGRSTEGEKAPVPNEPEKPAGKKYTSDERQAILKEVESMMLDHSVGESKVMVYVHQHKLAKEGQDEISALDTAVLDALSAVIPGLKKGAK